MANISDISPMITDLFSVISTLIGEVVTLITGDLLVLTIVSAFIGLIVGIIYMIFKFIKDATNVKTRMK